MTNQEQNMSKQRFFFNQLMLTSDVQIFSKICGYGVKIYGHIMHKKHKYVFMTLEPYWLKNTKCFAVQIYNKKHKLLFGYVGNEILDGLKDKLPHYKLAKMETFLYNLL